MPFTAPFRFGRHGNAGRRTARRFGQRIVKVRCGNAVRGTRGKGDMRCNSLILRVFGFESQLPQKQSLVALVN